MSRLLAVEWDEREARVALVNARAGQVVLQDAFSVSLPEPSPQRTPADIGGKIGAALSARGIAKMDCLVAVGRPSIELRHLMLPPAPDDELAELVRFQALREFNALGEDWPLDYLPLSGDEQQPRSVLAAAISPDQVEQIRLTCEGAWLKPRRLVLRPCAAASLLRRLQPGGSEHVRLLVDLLAEETDLTVLADNQVVYLRTTRLPSDTGDDDQSKALLAEIRRTMIAVQNRLGGGRVEAIYLFGDGPQQAALVQRIADDFGVPAQLVNPLSGLKLGDGLARTLPADPGRFAPLIGMLLDESSGAPPDLDFLHPRQKAVPPSRRRTYTMAGAGIGAFLLLLLLVCWWQLSSASAQIAKLRDESRELEKEVKTGAEWEKRVGEIDKWLAGEVNWLDELYRLVEKAPSAKDVMLTELRLQPPQARWGAVNGGELQLEGLSRESSGVDGLEQALRDPTHRVEVTDRQQEDRHKPYEWQFEASVVVEPGKSSRKAAAQPAAKPPVAANRPQAAR